MVERRISMADVAAAAGVSAQTVSRVVNASPRVDPATRARVEAAMVRLGYRPHRAARALRTGRSQTLGLIAATLASVGNSRMLQAVADAAAARGYALVVVALPDGEPISGAFERLREQGVDGIVVLNEASALAQAAEIPAGLDLVVVDAAADDRFHVVGTDHAGGARDATAHLLAAGHATVHHLGGPRDSFAAAERERGWRDALVAAGRSVPEPVRGDWSSASGRQAGGVLATDPDVSAVFVANDQMALGLLGALAAAERSVPSAVSVVGFDDVPDAAAYLPPLTTVRQDFDALGSRVVDLLVGGIEAAEASAEETASADRIPARLVVRSSTAPWALTAGRTAGGQSAGANGVSTSGAPDSSV